MINAKELRLGNYVYDSITKYPMRVDGIGRGWVNINFEGNEGGLWEATPEEIEPIRITDGVLEKAGFTEVYCYDCKRLDGNKVMEYYKHESRLRVWYKLPEDIVFECHGIRYLHQLQNAYYLATGHELEVKP